MKIAVCLGIKQQKENIQMLLPLLESHQLTFFTYENKIFEVESFEYKLNQPEFQCFQCNPETVGYMENLEDLLEPFDLTITFGSGNIFSYQAHKAKKQNDNLFIVVENDTVPFYYEQNDNIIKIKKEVLNVADAIIATSELSRIRLITEGCSDNIITVIYPWITKQSLYIKCDKILDFRSFLKLKEDDFLILCLGNLINTEMAFGLLNAVNYLDETVSKDLSSKIKMLFAKPFKEAEHLKKRALMTGINKRAMFLEDLPLEYYRSVLMASDLVIAGECSVSHISNSYPMTTFPFDLLKAMVVEKPLLVAKTGVISEIVDKGGMQVEVGNFAELGEVVLSLMQDAQMREYYSTSSKERAHKMFSPEKLINSYEKLFLSLEQGLHQRKKKQTTTANQGRNVTKLEDNMRDRVAVNGVVNKVEDKGTVDRAGRVVEEDKADIDYLLSNKEYLKCKDLVERKLAGKKLQCSEEGTYLSIQADCMNHLGDLAGAVGKYELALRKNPHEYKAFTGLGSIAIQMGQYDQALSFLQKALKMNSLDEKVLLGIGICQLSLLNVDEAIIWVQKSLDIAPKNQLAVLTMLQIANVKQDYEIVENALYEYVQFYPNNIPMLIHLARTYQKQNKQNELKKVIDRVYSIDPDNPEINMLINENTNTSSTETSNS